MFQQKQFPKEVWAKNLRAWVGNTVFEKPLSSLIPLWGLSGYVLGFALPINGNILLIVLLAAAMASLRSSPQFELVDKKAFLFVLLFILSMAVSTLRSLDIERSLKLSASLLPALLVFFIIAIQVNTTKRLTFLYSIFTFLALELSLLFFWSVYQNGVAMLVTGNHVRVLLRGMQSPILIEANDIAISSLIAPFSIVIFSLGPKSILGITALVSILMSLFVMVCLQSGVAVLALMASTTGMVFLLWPKRAVLCFPLLLVVALLADALNGFPLLTKFGNVWREGALWDFRALLWGSAWMMFLQAPFFGNGPHTFAIDYQQYLSRLDVPAGFPVDPRFTPWPHNLYLETLAEQGIVGFFVLLALIGFLFWATWKTRKNRSPEVARLGAGAFGSLVGFCTAGGLELSFLRQWVVLMLFALLGIVTALLNPNVGESTHEYEYGS